MSSYYQSSALKRSGSSPSPEKSYKFLRRDSPRREDLGRNEEPLRRQILSFNNKDEFLRRKSNSPKRKGSPLRINSPKRKITSPRRYSPKRKESPLRRYSPKRNESPPRRYSPRRRESSPRRRDDSPYQRFDVNCRREISPRYKTDLLSRRESPPRRYSPNRKESPLRRNSPKRKQSPLIRNSPKRKVSPLRRNSPRRKQSPLRRNSPKRKESPPRRNSPKRMKSPLRRNSPIRNESPLRRYSPKRKESPTDLLNRRESPPKRYSPKRKESPLRRNSPKRKQSPLRRNSPKRKQSPLRRNSPKRKESPLRRNSPKRKQSPLRRNSPKRKKSPLRRNSPKRKESPLRRNSPRRVESPARRNSPKRKESPPKRRRDSPCERFDIYCRRESPSRRNSPKRKQSPLKRNFPKINGSPTRIRDVSPFQKLDIHYSKELSPWEMTDLLTITENHPRRKEIPISRNSPKRKETPPRKINDSLCQRPDVVHFRREMSPRPMFDLISKEESSYDTIEVDETGRDYFTRGEKSHRKRGDSPKKIKNDLWEKSDDLTKQPLSLNIKKDFASRKHKRKKRESTNLEQEELPTMEKVSSNKRCHHHKVRGKRQRKESFLVKDSSLSKRNNGILNHETGHLQSNNITENGWQHEVMPNFEKENVQHCPEECKKVSFNLSKCISACQSEYSDDSCVQSYSTHQCIQGKEFNFVNEKDSLVNKQVLNNKNEHMIISGTSNVYELGKDNEKFENSIEDEVLQKSENSNCLKSYQDHVTIILDESERIREHDECKEDIESNNSSLSTDGVQLRESRHPVGERLNKTIKNIPNAHVTDMKLQKCPFSAVKNINDEGLAKASENVAQIGDLLKRDLELSCEDLKNTTGCTRNSSDIENENVSLKEEEMSEESRIIQQIPALREFDIIDELEDSESEEGELHDVGSTDSHSDSGEEVPYYEVPLDDLDAMLDEDLPEKFKLPNKERVVRLKRKVILEEIGYDHFDLLPEGWIQIMHSSGMPVYLHQKTRVCTMARPYYLGPGSSRNHKVPLSAIPCLQYKRALDEEKKNKEEREENNIRDQNHLQSNQPVTLIPAKIETSEENEAAQSLEALELRDYCKNVFSFKTITLIPFKSWGDRRKYVRMTKDLKKRQRPTLPGGTKLLKFPIQNPDGTNAKSKGEWIINPNGKSYVCILHEYVQHALKKHPKYEFKELENPATPYSATVFIDGMQYSDGIGASKKQAKIEAAKLALEVLIPEMRDKIERDSPCGMRSGITKRSQNNDLSIFDQITVEDPRVAEFCTKTTEPPPYAILLNCLARNMGLGDISMNYEMNSKKHKEDEFTMKVGNHEVKVVCKNKRDGKQRAAQAILQALHPNIKYWGSLLRMYGNRSIKNVKEKKQEEQEITGLQSKASLNQPNYAILNKLRTEIKKIKAKRDAITAKGKFIPPHNIILPSLSTSDLNKVNLS